MADVALEDIDRTEPPTRVRFRKHPDFVAAVEQPDKADETGGESSYYKDLASQDDAQDQVSMALTGKNYSELSPAEKEIIDRIILEMSLGLFDVKVVEEGGDVSMEEGVHGAYVHGENGEPGTIYIAEGLTKEERRVAMREELGEAFAARAEDLGLNVAEGDVGNRLVLVGQGKTISRDETPELFADTASNTTTVTVMIDGKKHTFEAKARDTSDPDGDEALTEMETNLEGATGRSYEILADGTVLITGTNADGELFEYALTPGQDANGNAIMTVTGTVYDENGVAYVYQDTFVVTGEDNINAIVTDISDILNGVGLRRIIFDPVTGTFIAEPTAHANILTWIDTAIAGAESVEVSRADDGGLIIIGTNADGTQFKIEMTITVADDGTVSMSVSTWDIAADGTATPDVENYEISGEGSVLSFISQTSTALGENGFIEVGADLTTGFFTQLSGDASDIVAWHSNIMGIWPDSTETVVDEDGNVVVTTNRADGGYYTTTYSTSIDANGEQVVTVTATYTTADGRVLEAWPTTTVVGEANVNALLDDLNGDLTGHGEMPVDFYFTPVTGPEADAAEVLDWSAVAAEEGLFDDAGPPVTTYNSDGSFSVTYTNSDGSTYVVNYVPGKDGNGDNYVDVSYTYTDADGNVTTGAKMSAANGDTATRVYLNEEGSSDQFVAGINTYLAANDPNFTDPINFFYDTGGFSADLNGLAAFAGTMDEVDTLIDESENVTGSIDANGNYVMTGEKDGQTWTVTIEVWQSDNGNRNMRITGEIEVGVDADGEPITEQLFNSATIMGNDDDFMAGLDLFNTKMGELYPTSFKTKMWSEEKQSLIAVDDDTVYGYADYEQTTYYVDEDTENGTVVGEIYVTVDGERVAYSSLPAEVRAKFDISLTDGSGAFGLNDRGQVVVVDSDALTEGETTLDWQITIDSVEYSGGVTIDDVTYSDTMTFEVTADAGASTGTSDAVITDTLQLIAQYVGNGTVDDIVIDAEGNMTITGTTADGAAFTITLTPGTGVDGEPTLTLTGTIDDPDVGQVDMFDPIIIEDVDPTLDFLNLLFSSLPDLAPHSEHNMFQIEIDPSTGGIVTKDPASGYIGPYGTETGYGNDHSTYGIPQDAEIVSVVTVPAGTGPYGDHEVQMVTYVDAETGETVTAAVDVGEGSETYGYVLAASVTDADGNMVFYDTSGAVIKEMTAAEIAELQTEPEDLGVYPDGQTAGASTAATTTSAADMDSVVLLPGHTTVFQQSTMEELNLQLNAQGIPPEDVVESGIKGPMAWVTYYDREAGHYKTTYRWVDEESGEVYGGTVVAGTAEGNAVANAIYQYKDAYGGGVLVAGAVGVGVFAGAGAAWASLIGVGEGVAAGLVTILGPIVGSLIVVGGFGLVEGFRYGSMLEGDAQMNALINGEVGTDSPTLTGHFAATSDDIVTPPDDTTATVADDPVDLTPEQIAADEALAEADRKQEEAEAQLAVAQQSSQDAEDARAIANERRALAEENPDNAVLQANADDAEANADALEAIAEEDNQLAIDMGNDAVAAAESAVLLAEAAAVGGTREEFLEDPRVLAASARYNSAVALLGAAESNSFSYDAEIDALKAEREADRTAAIAAEPGATDWQIWNAGQKATDAEEARTQADSMAYYAESDVVMLAYTKKEADRYQATLLRSNATTARNEATYWDQEATRLEAAGDPGAAAARQKATEADADAYAAEQEATAAETQADESELEFDAAVMAAPDRIRNGWLFEPTQSSSGEIGTGYSAYGIPEDATIGSQTYIPGYGTSLEGDANNGDLVVITYERESEPGVVYTVVIDADPASDTYGYVLEASKSDPAVGVTYYDSTGAVIGEVTIDEMDTAYEDAVEDSGPNERGLVIWNPNHIIENAMPEIEARGGTYTSSSLSPEMKAFYYTTTDPENPGNSVDWVYYEYTDENDVVHSGHARLDTEEGKAVKAAAAEFEARMQTPDGWMVSVVGSIVSISPAIGLAEGYLDKTGRNEVTAGLGIGALGVYGMAKYLRNRCLGQSGHRIMESYFRDASESETLIIQDPVAPVGTPAPGAGVLDNINGAQVAADQAQAAVGAAGGALDDQIELAMGPAFVDEQFFNDHINAMNHEIEAQNQVIAQADAVLADPNATTAQKNLASQMKDRAVARKAVLQAEIVIREAQRDGGEITPEMEDDYNEAMEDFLVLDIAMHEGAAEYYGGQYAYMLANPENFTSRERAAALREQHKAKAKKEEAETTKETWEETKPKAWT